MQIQFTPSSIERFWSRVDKSGDCWEWTASREGAYGKIGLSGQRFKVHRVAFELAYGPIPEGMLVLHVCDNPLCVRNDDIGTYEVSGVLRPRRGHLWLGTDKDNMVDMVAKGRNKPHVGEKNSQAKLTAREVLAIRARHANSHPSQNELAREYDVGQRTIGDILLRKTWREL